jgi:hypothetical protein
MENSKKMFELFDLKYLITLKIKFINTPLNE